MQRHSQLTMASSIHRLSRPSRPPACTLPPIPESQSVFSVHYQTVASEPFDVVQIEYVDDDESSLGSLESCCCSECERVVDVDDEILFSVVSPRRAPTPDESEDPSESTDSHISTSPIVPRTSETEQPQKKKAPLSFLRSFRTLSPEISSRNSKTVFKGQSTDANPEGIDNKRKGIFKILKSGLRLKSRETASLNNVDDDSKSDTDNRSPRAGVFPRLHSF
ncbi:hypothetical protein IW262DRAFT_1498047 [Armillaria fumosa]|nr:hypothetical protein IW262DRAFT_1498047 [Armillaria fumosa]